MSFTATRGRREKIRLLSSYKKKIKWRETINIALVFTITVTLISFPGTCFKIFYWIRTYCQLDHSLLFEYLFEVFEQGEFVPNQNDKFQ